MLAAGSDAVSSPGQRQGLPLQPPATDLLRTRDREPLHQALPALDKRESRSTDQDTPAPVGLPLRLPHKRAPRNSAPRLPQLVQPTKTPPPAHSPTPHKPRLTRLWSVQLAATAAAIEQKRRTDDDDSRADSGDSTARTAVDAICASSSALPAVGTLMARTAALAAGVAPGPKTPMPPGLPAMTTTRVPW
jgi:hypothetical protein